LAGWSRADVEIDNEASGGKVKRQMVESLWMNFVPITADADSK
jgi:hypothetical protein